MLQERLSVGVGELGELFGVSEVTIRTDLAYLAGRGLAVRTHGGATLPERRQLELSHAARERTNVELKQRIANAAIDLVANHESVMLDASTTALQIARAIKQRGGWQDLTVVTNGIFTAIELVGAPGVTTIITGGVVRETAVSVTGGLAEELLSKVNANVGFFGGLGLTAKNGLTDADIQEIQMKSSMVDACQKVVAVVDHTKLGQLALATFAPIDRIDLVITDSEGDTAELATIRAAVPELRVV
ncbi:MAG: DeoR/GlpR family DNA-binding transcription regulator [Chloroflexota bacterium]|nr:DeoR/GlpR family DNA-binding transcription regulator [Chloroflexota bacterium]